MTRTTVNRAPWTEINWKKLTCGFFVFTMFSVHGARSTVHAAFEDNGTGARATALGGAYAAIADDVYGLLYNPATLAQIHERQAATEYSKLYTGLSDNSDFSQYFLGYGQPLGPGSVALGWKQFNADSLFSERTLSLGYGAWVGQTLAIGGAFKQLHHSFNVPNQVVDDQGNIQPGTPQLFADNGSAKSAYSGDLGILYRPVREWTVGVSVQDVNEPNVALSPSDKDVVARTCHVEAAYQAPAGVTAIAGFSTRQALAHERDYVATGALEKWWAKPDQDGFAARAGVSGGNREYRQISMGAGYRLSPIQIDYAFVFNVGGISLGDTAGTHRVSMLWRFGPTAPGGNRPAQQAERRPSLRLVELTIEPVMDETPPDPGLRHVELVIDWQPADDLLAQAR